MNVVIVGCGNVAEKYVLGLSSIKEASLTGFFDLDAGRAAQLASKRNARVYKNFDEVLNDKNIDLVVNLTPPEMHYEVSAALLRADKNVFSEKPAALQASQAFALTELASRKNCVFVSAPDTFLAEPFRTAKNLYDEKAIGLAASFSGALVCPGHELWHPAPEFYYKKGAGPLWDMGPYFITQLVAMLGAVASVSAMGGAPAQKRPYVNRQGEARVIDVEVPTHYDVILEMKNGVTGTFTASYDVSVNKRPYFDIYGTGGVLSLENPDEYRGKISLQTNNISREILCPETSLPPRARGIGIADMFSRMAKNESPQASGFIIGHVIQVLESIDRSLQEKIRIDLS